MEQFSAIAENSEDHLKVCILILNEVLKEIPICNSYRNFCNLVGDNFMTCTDFEFWYYRLRRFKNFDYNRSVDPVELSFKNMVDSLVMRFDKIKIDVLDTYLENNTSSECYNDDHQKMYVLILNEVLRKKPIFHSYLNFCKLVGENTINYPDFEFWYYRIYRLYRGEHDDCDQIINPVRKTIMDMPVSLMYKITGYLDTVERTYLRSMNRCLKDIVDFRPPSFDVIDISADDKSLKWKLDNKLFSCGLSDYGGRFLKILNSSSEIKHNECYFKKGMEYLSPVLKMANLKVNHLSLNIMNGSAHLNNLLPVPFHMKNVSIRAFNINKSLELLSALNPGELESIHFVADVRATREDILEFYETEQFKKAKRVESNIYLHEYDLLRFSHLKSFKFPINYREPVDFEIIRDIISTFDKFESCELKSINYGDGFDIRTVAEDLGAEIPFGPLLKTITYRYRVPESKNYLEFKIGEEESHCYIKIVKIR
ncbi:hypothetical protein B9Z55_026925 [Caenorhabditis nigoni]|nr:hypothetical protein B9Z55_026925 [Caenorhabditis nigoni]